MVFLMRKKIYGQSREQTCMFCEKRATTENEQGLPSCIKHKNDLMDDKVCVCGEYMCIKKSKWGAFFLCPNCGPISMNKAMSMQARQGFKLNKSFREKREKRLETSNRNKKTEKIYTIDELEHMWEDKE